MKMHHKHKSALYRVVQNNTNNLTSKSRGDKSKSYEIRNLVRKRLGSTHWRVSVASYVGQVSVSLLTFLFQAWSNHSGRTLCCAQWGKGRKGKCDNRRISGSIFDSPLLQRKTFSDINSTCKNIFVPCTIPENLLMLFCPIQYMKHCFMSQSWTWWHHKTFRLPGRLNAFETCNEVTNSSQKIN